MKWLRFWNDWVNRNSKSIQLFFISVDFVILGNMTIIIRDIMISLSYKNKIHSVISRSAFHHFCRFFSNIFRAISSSIFRRTLWPQKNYISSWSHAFKNFASILSFVDLLTSRYERREETTAGVAQSSNDVLINKQKRIYGS